MLTCAKIKPGSICDHGILVAFLFGILDVNCLIYLGTSLIRLLNLLASCSFFSISAGSMLCLLMA